MDARALLRARKAAAAATSSSTASKSSARPSTSTSTATATSKHAQQASTSATAAQGGTSGLPAHATLLPGGTMKCTVCQLGGIKHWESHTSSKQHRQSLARYIKAEQKQAARAKHAVGPAEGDDEVGANEEETAGPAMPPGGTTKRAAGDDVQDSAAAGKRRRLDDNKVQEGAATGQAASSASMQGGQNGVDAELDDFLSSIAGDVAAPTPAATSGPEQKKVYRPSQPETQISYEAAPIRNLPASTATAADGTAPTAEDEEEEETEADRRKRMQREEKEEIMDRLFEEQRAQEDADQRVSSLKARLEMVRKRRQEMTEKKKKEKDEATLGV